MIKNLDEKQKHRAILWRKWSWRICGALLILGFLYFLYAVFIVYSPMTCFVFAMTNMGLWRNCFPAGHTPYQAQVDGPPLRIGIVTFFAGKLGDSVAELSISNKQIYARKHDYPLIVEERPYTTRRFSWNKVRLMQKYLHKFDWILWVDIDTFFMEMDVPLTVFIDPAYDMNVSVNEHGANAGVIFMKNSAWSRNFLRTWWDQEDFVRNEGRGSGDQHALRHPMKKEDIRSHIKTFPQCAFNSRVELQFWRWYHFFMNGDFLVHFAGLSPTRKLLLMENFAQNDFYSDRSFN